MFIKLTVVVFIKIHQENVAIKKRKTRIFYMDGKVKIFDENA